LLDRVAPAQDAAATLKRHGLPAQARLIALLPGSRRGEIRYMLRPMVEAARVLAADHSLVPVIALAPTLTPAQLRDEGRVDLDGIRVVEGDTYSIIAAAYLTLTASGTATLETTLLGCPMVVCYRMSPLTYAAARVLVRGVEFIAMPNILADRRVVPELIQRQVTVSNLVRAAENLMVEPLRSETRAALLGLRSRLGEPGAAARVAAIALEMMA
jgi:lipid-A-disaccharide synthase